MAPLEATPQVAHAETTPHSDQERSNRNGKTVRDGASDSALAATPVHTRRWMTWDRGTGKISPCRQRYVEDRLKVCGHAKKEYEDDGQASVRRPPQERRRLF